MSEEELRESINKFIMGFFADETDDDQLVSMVVGRLREIPQNEAYEMVAHYGLAHQFLAALMRHGIKVERQGSQWWVANAHGTFFPVAVTSGLPKGSFILRPRGGVTKMAKKKKKKGKGNGDGDGY